MTWLQGDSVSVVRVINNVSYEVQAKCLPDGTWESCVYEWGCSPELCDDGFSTPEEAITSALEKAEKEFGASL